MKNVSVVLNVVLLAAVGFLYYKVFSGKSTVTANNAAKPVVSREGAADNQATGRIAFIDIDSLQSSYTYYKNLKADFERRQKAASNELEEKQRRYQSRVGQLQQKAATMTPQEQDAAGQEVGAMERDMQKRKQEIESELFKYTNDMKENVYRRLEGFLKEYNKDGRYAYILSYEPSFMFYKDSALNITGDVITGLNEADKKKQQ